jgi:Polyketide cyclase / dehydrase and lipid transport
VTSSEALCDDEPVTSAVDVSQSRTYPVPVEQAFDAVLATPLEQLFAQRFGALPPIRTVRDQDGRWGSVGQSRTIVLTDGGTMREELETVRRPEVFSYRMSDFTGPMKTLVGAATGRWAFAPAGTGVRITWSWTIQPSSQIAALAMPAFGWMWRGYARRALGRLEQILLDEPAG